MATGHSGSVEAAHPILSACKQVSHSRALLPHLQLAVAAVALGRGELEPSPAPLCLFLSRDAFRCAGGCVFCGGASWPRAAPSTGDALRVILSHSFVPWHVVALCHLESVRLYRGHCFDKVVPQVFSSYFTATASLECQCLYSLKSRLIKETG